MEQARVYIHFMRLQYESDIGIQQVLLFRAQVYTLLRERERERERFLLCPSFVVFDTWPWLHCTPISILHLFYRINVLGVHEKYFMALSTYSLTTNAHAHHVENSNASNTQEHIKNTSFHIDTVSMYLWYRICWHVCSKIHACI